MNQYTGLQKYLESYESEKCFKFNIGRFSLKSNAEVLIILTIEPSESLEKTYKFGAYDAEDIDNEDAYYIHSFTNSITSADDILSTINEEYYLLLDVLHTKLVVCRHCREIFGINNIDYEMYGFSELGLCNDCGVQNIYDSKYSEEKCCICLDAIGYGEYIAVCGDNRHKLHYGCGRKQSICPLCKCGPPEIDTDEED
jgi:hypothetical protein